MQRVRRCHLPRGEGRAGWRVALDLGLAMGLELPPWADADEVLAALGGEVGAFRDLSGERIGLLGVMGA